MGVLEMDEHTPGKAPTAPADSTPRRTVPAVLLGLWALIWGLMCGAMLLSVILGLVCFVVGLLSLVLGDLPLQMNLGDSLVQTAGQKALFAAVGAALAITGSLFWWLRQRGYTAAAVVLYLAVTLVVFVLTRVTASNSLISIG